MDRPVTRSVDTQQTPFHFPSLWSLFRKGLFHEIKYYIFYIIKAHKSCHAYLPQALYRQSVHYCFPLQLILFNSILKLEYSCVKFYSTIANPIDDSSTLNDESVRVFKVSEKKGSVSSQTKDIELDSEVFLERAEKCSSKLLKAMPFLAFYRLFRCFSISTHLKLFSISKEYVQTIVHCTCFWANRTGLSYVNLVVNLNLWAKFSPLGSLKMV